MNKKEVEENVKIAKELKGLFRKKMIELLLVVKWIIIFIIVFLIIVMIITQIGR